MQKDLPFEILLNDIKVLGLRVTPLKEAILSILFETEQPISVREITAKLKKRKLNPNKSSLYRELKTLRSVQILSELRIGKRASSYELKHLDEHHHHFVCKRCKKIVDFKNKNLENAMDRIVKSLKKQGLQAKEHELNFFGRCASCQ